MTADALLGRLDRVRKAGKGWTARCPAHDDKTASLSIAEADDRVLVHCFAGCAPSSVLASVGMELADLFDPKGENQPLKRNDRDLAFLSVIRRSPALHHDLEIIRLGSDAIRRRAALTPDDVGTFNAALRRFDDFISLFKRN